MRSGLGGGSAETAIIQPNPGIGDMVWHVPALRAIAAQLPERRFVLMTRPSVQAERLFLGEEMVAGVVTLASARGPWNLAWSFARLVAALRRGRFRRVYILHRGPRFSLAARLAGVPERIGYGVAGGRHWLTRPVEVGPITSGVDTVDALDRFLPGLGIAEPTRIPALSVAEEARQEVARRFSDRPRPWVVLGVGANGADRRWPPERFAELAPGLAQLGVGTVFVLASAGEASLAAGVAAAAPGVAAPVADLTVDRAMALIEAADLFVGNDSGPMNLAAALGRPTLGLVGSPRSRIPFDRLPRLTAVTPPEGCLGIERLGVATVLAAVRAALAQKAGGLKIGERARKRRRCDESRVTGPAPPC